MKKLLLLFLVVFAGVISANAKTIYVENTKGWGTVYLHYWNGESHGGGGTEWPGIVQTNKESIDGKDIYTIDLGDNEYFILNDGTGGDYKQTANLVSSDYQDGAYYYIYSVGTSAILSEMTLYTYNFTVTSDNNWDTFYIYLFKNGNPVTGWSWPGKPMEKNGNVYTYTYKTFQNNGEDLGVIFNNGVNGQQTDDMEASVGDNEYDLNGTTASVEVKTNAFGFATFVNANHLNLPEGVTAYTATDLNNGSATLVAITNPAANTPMLIKGAASTTYEFTITTSGTTAENNAFKAGPVTGLESEFAGKYNYILNGEGFYAANGKNVGEGKAYLQLSANAGQSAKVYFPNGEATSISSIMGEGEGTNVYYNLQGMQVSNPTKGLYIVNGKKYIIK